MVKAFSLKPIRTQADHEAASRMLRRLVGSKPEAQFTAGERDYIDCGPGRDRAVADRFDSVVNCEVVDTRAAP